MVKEMQKGNKSPYHGYLLGVHEYEDYLRLKELAPLFMKQLKDIKEARNI